MTAPGRRTKKPRSPQPFAWIGVLLAGALVPAACSLGVTGEVPPEELCDAETECAPSDNPCRVARCPTGRCELLPIADGPLGTQTLGDCLVVRCEAGESTTTADPSDADDGDPCTIDSCAENGPLHAPAADGAPCSQGAQVGTCLAGSCSIACQDASDCPHGPCQIALCDNSKCITQPISGQPTEVVPDPADCQRPVCTTGVLGTEIDDTDVPDDANPCTTESCNLGSPESSFVAAGLATGCTGFCDGAGACVDCLINNDCGAATLDCTTPTCQPGGTCADLQNLSGAACNLGPGVCDALGVCVACLVDADCGAAAHCESNVCYSCTNSIQDPGETGIDCGATACGACLGETCASNPECGSGFCRDTVCCSSSCLGPCRSCLAAQTGGSDGTCAPIVPNTDPGNECAGSDVCCAGAMCGVAGCP